jgi:mycobactin lysine-N-oxygenase
VAVYSWQRCLIDSAMYADWVDRGRPHPQHRAWARYLRWVFDQIRPTLRAARLTGACL